MIEEIKKVYYEINNDFIQKTPFNTQQVRHETIQKILLHLESVFTDDYVFRVLCDETNNTPEIIDNNQLIARVEWRLRKRSEEAIDYIELTFGDVDVVWETKNKYKDE